MEESSRSELRTQSFNLNLIEKDLWLGNLTAATDVRLLEEKRVKSLLTINSFPLPKEIRNLNFIEKKYIQVFDTPEEDLLSHFEETYDFIASGLKKGVVLVHCYFGISRSATIVLSYIMKKKHMALGEALRYVKTKREFIEPNPGFLEQLKLYESMNFSLDKHNVQYKMFRLYMTLHRVRKENGISKCLTDITEPDPLQTGENADPTMYKCRKCRRLLASGLNEIPHVSNGAHCWKDLGSKQFRERTGVCQLSYFIGPLTWMENVDVCLEGKLHCPNKNCGSKLGSFNWISGVQCPCGTNVCPGFSLIPSKVDKQKKYPPWTARCGLRNYLRLRMPKFIPRTCREHSETTVLFFAE